MCGIKAELHLGLIILHIWCKTFLNTLLHESWGFSNLAGVNRYYFQFCVSSRYHCLWTFQVVSSHAYVDQYSAKYLRGTIFISLRFSLLSSLLWNNLSWQSNHLGLLTQQAHWALPAFSLSTYILNVSLQRSLAYDSVRSQGMLLTYLSGPLRSPPLNQGFSSSSTCLFSSLIILSKICPTGR